ncbi:MAG: biopolymer transporter ExbD [Chthoniobacteraceae bacterium]
MKLQRTFDFPTALFGIMPMLNVLFLVLVFYVLGSRFLLNPGVQVSLPATSFALGPQRNSEIISITAGPVPAIYHRDREVTLDELRERLATNRAAEKWLIIKADRNTPAGVLAAVTDEALRRSYSVIFAGDIPKP